jgi:hypothetical protein
VVTALTVAASIAIIAAETSLGILK